MPDTAPLRLPEGWITRHRWAAALPMLSKNTRNFELAFQEYNKSFRPFIEEVQADVVNFGWTCLCQKPKKPFKRE